MAEYTIAPARYSRGNMALSCPSPDGYLTRAGRLAQHLRGRYTHRERAYIISPAKAAKFVSLYDAGRDACSVTRELR